MVAMDDSASMLCARVMRGISSMAKNETPARASSSHLFGRGQRFAEADHDLAVAQQGQIRAPFRRIRAQRTHLDDDVGLLENVGAGANTCRPGYILLVWKTRVDTSRLFDDYAGAQLSQCLASREASAQRAAHRERSRAALLWSGPRVTSSRNL